MNDYSDRNTAVAYVCRLLDARLAGHHIKLRAIYDTYTHLKRGAIGKVTGVWSDCTNVIRIDVLWNNGSNLSLIFGTDDFEVLD